MLSSNLKGVLNELPLPAHKSWMDIARRENHRKKYQECLPVFDKKVWSPGNTLPPVVCGNISEAEHQVCRLSQYDRFSINGMLAAHVSHGQADRTLQVFEQMAEEGIIPDVKTFLSMLQACSILAKTEIGVSVDHHEDGIKVQSLGKVKALHALAWNCSYESNLIICSTLISMYSKCGSSKDAQATFDSLCNRDLVAWNAMLATYAQHGQGEKALLLYRQLLEQGLSPDSRTYVCALQACGMLAEKEDSSERSLKVKALAIVKELYAAASKEGCDSNLYVGNTLVSTYGKCGNIIDAQYVFDGLTQRSVVTWNAIVAAQGQHGEGDKALHLYEQMLVEGMIPSRRTLASAIQAFASQSGKEESIDVDGQLIKANSLEKGKALHFEVWRQGYHTDIFIGSSLLKMYSNCGSMVDAQKVSDGFLQCDVVLCNTMLTAYVHNGQAAKSMQLYKQMLQEGVIPNIRTLTTVLQICGMLAEEEEAIIVDGQLTKPKSLELGKSIHFQAWKNGWMSDVFIGSTLISMYSKCGCIASARQAFDVLHHRNAVSWNAILGAYAQQGEAKKVLHLYAQMLDEAVQPNDRSLVYALQACGILLEDEDVVDGHATKVKILETGKALHADSWKKGFLSDVFLGNTLVSMYAKFGSIIDAQDVFNGLSEHNVVSWTALLSAYVKQGQGEKALQLYEQMLEEGVDPNNWTFVTVLQAYGEVLLGGADDVSNGPWMTAQVLGKARGIHAAAWKMGFTSDCYINSTLVVVYTACGSTVDAQQMFDGLHQPNIVSWNAMLTVYAQQGEGEELLHVYQRMLEEGVSPDVRTFVSVLQACGMLIDDEDNVIKVESRGAQIGKIVHAEAWTRGYTSNAFICSTLISMYGKSESIFVAKDLFDGLTERNVVAWNAMLGAYAQQGEADEAFQLFNRMLREAASPNEVTFVCMLQACGNGGSLLTCTEIHQRLVSAQIGMSPRLASALIHAYAQCASMSDAQNVFNELLNPSIVSWTALIAGYAYDGNYNASLQLFEEMLLKGMKPDAVTFLAVLSVCSHAGLVHEGLKYFESMSRDHGIFPDMEHYATVVDLLGRAGSFTRIEDLLFTMPLHPNLSLWLCLLSSCRKHSHVELGRLAFDHSVHLQPKNAAAYTIMSSIYAQVGHWEIAKEVNELRERAGAWRVPAKSWIGHDHHVHSFVVKDHNHPCHIDLYDILATLSSRLKSKNSCLTPSG